MLAGVTDKNLDLFAIKTQNLSISSSSLQNLENLITKRADHFSGLTVAALGPNVDSSAINITAADLGLADKYKVALWGYCSTTGSHTNCTKAKFDWAATSLNTSTIESLASSITGTTVTLPKELKTSLNTYKVVSKWTQVVYIAAIITCALEVFLSLFAFCSRAGSCITFLISGLSTTTIICASILATVQSSIVTAAVKSVAKAYGVNASINTSFLATTWMAVAFSVASGFFWMFTICCCAADHSSKKSKNRGSMNDQEKLIPTGAYQRVDDSQHYNAGFGGQQQGVYHPPGQQKPARGNAYEPYSHTAI
jgi:hypothetical protein